MDEKFFKDDELPRLRRLYRRLLSSLDGQFSSGDISGLRTQISEAALKGTLARDRFGFNPILSAMTTASALCQSVDPDKNMVLAILLSAVSRSGHFPEGAIARHWGDDVARLVRGIDKVASLYSRNASVENENFRKLLLTFAEDIRVIIIMIVDRLALMRSINHHPSENLVREAAYEVNYLYAPLAHRLGLYAIKSELEEIGRAHV